MLRGPLGLFLGVTYPFRALILLIRMPKLWGYVLVPILLNLVLGIILYTGALMIGLRGVDTFLADLPIWAGDISNQVTHLPHLTVNLPAWMPRLPDWSLQLPDGLSQLTAWQFRWPEWVYELPDWGLVAFGWVLRLLLTALLLVVTGFVLLQFGVILGAPWYGKLSEELEKLRTGQLPILDVSLGGALRDIWRAVMYELKKLVLSLVVGVGLLLVNFLPGAGTAIATLGGIALATTIVCLDFLDPALERRRLSFRSKLAIIGRSLPASASFGLICLGLISIPLLNLLAIPVCITAGTLFFCDRILPEQHLVKEGKKAESA
jgi:CysZ protein